MRVSYNWLQSFFAKELPKPEKLAELLTLHSFEVENLEKKSGDFLLDIDVLPNRKHDCLSHIGIAREIAAILNYEIKNTKREIQNKSKIHPVKFASQLFNGVNPVKFASRLFNGIKIQEPKLCFRYIGAIIQGIKTGPSPEWLKERLEVLGQRTINNIVDAVNYAMLELGQPLHAFDADKIEGVIMVRRAENEEKIETLDNEKIKLDKDVLVIADNKSLLAIAGIKGGKKAEITENTKNIILEAANFEPVNIRKTSRRIGLVTDSSLRFSAGLDPELAKEAMERVINLIIQIAGGRQSEPFKDFFLKKRKISAIPLNLKKINSVLGADISRPEVKNILTRLGCSIKEKKGNIFLVTPPSFRLDLEIGEDLIEEVGRIRGYDKITACPAKVELSDFPKNETAVLRSRFKDRLKALGFSEAYNYSFAGEKEIGFFGNNRNIFKLKNPSKPEFAFLRPSLLFGLAAVLEKNLKYEKTLKFFEIGKIFCQKEEEKLSLATASLDWRESQEAFFELKGALCSFLESFGLTDYWFDDAFSPGDQFLPGGFFHPYQASEIKIGEKKIGLIGALHPEAGKEFKIKGKAAFSELDFDLLLNLVAEENEYLPISKYPAVTRDLAILVPIETKMAEVADVIENSGGEFLIDADLFDVYQGKELEEEKKNFAFHLIFQSQEKTLSDQEVDRLMEKIIKALEENPAWETRK
ncbi:MAG: phenylalanine--tRNA ligase subunit beta [Candidatus Niyogibacteria bacterium]|nr:phenylalanine--tRNA ligase subunit beta [Candidatus Niyogibacteria bacterium]